MEDWVGGRTSVMSVVGLVPAVLQGVNVDDLLEGARLMDEKTRRDCVKCNASMKLALAWYKATGGKGRRIWWFSLIRMPWCSSPNTSSSSLWNPSASGWTWRATKSARAFPCTATKGSTDQHAYVQQLRDGVNNFFATFIEVRECSADAVEVEAGATCGDFLQGFLRGTRQALAESGRSSITISIPEVNAKTLGMLIALFERAVSFYASLVNINAYHQPGVEAGKKRRVPSWPCWAG